MLIQRKRLQHWRSAWAGRWAPPAGGSLPQCTGLPAGATGHPPPSCSRAAAAVNPAPLNASDSDHAEQPALLLPFPAAGPAAVQKVTSSSRHPSSAHGSQSPSQPYEPRTPPLPPSALMQHRLSSMPQVALRPQPMASLFDAHGTQQPQAGGRGPRARVAPAQEPMAFSWRQAPEPAASTGSPLIPAAIPAAQVPVHTTHFPSGHGQPPPQPPQLDYPAQQPSPPSSVGCHQLPTPGAPPAKASGHNWQQVRDQAGVSRSTTAGTTLLA